jgi:hypothetical protein
LILSLLSVPGQQGCAGQTFHPYDKIPNINNFREEGFIFAHGFSPSSLSLLILGLWCGRKSWLWEHVGEAIHLMVGRNGGRGRGKEDGRVGWGGEERT